MRAQQIIRITTYFILFKLASRFVPELNLYITYTEQYVDDSIQ